MLRFLALIVIVLANLLVSCSNCAAPCVDPTSTILQTQGYLVVAVESTCGSTRSPLPGPSVMVDALPEMKTCHFDVTLDDGERIGLDVPFTKDGQRCCCGNCTTVKVPDWSAPTITAPAGYVPQLDAGPDSD
jgi:hypothetical protein